MEALLSRTKVSEAAEEVEAMEASWTEVVETEACSEVETLETAVEEVVEVWEDLARSEMEWALVPSLA